MNELIWQITQRTGISDDQARMAVETVAGFLKTKLPEPFAGQVDAALSGQYDGMAQQASQMLGGLFNKE